MTLPTMPIVAVPGGNCCLFRLQRGGKGTRKIGAGTPYACAPHKTVRVTTVIAIGLAPPAAPNQACDETASLFPGPLTLETPGGDPKLGTTIYREDGFGLFFGECEIK